MNYTFVYKILKVGANYSVIRIERAVDSGNRHSGSIKPVASYNTAAGAEYAAWLLRNAKAPSQDEECRAAA